MDTPTDAGGPVRRSALAAYLLFPAAKALLGCINRVFRKTSPDPSFFDTATFPWVREVEAMYPAIREECLSAIADLNRVPNLEQLGDSGAGKLASGAAWKAVLLYVFGRPIGNNAARCPRTCEALGKIPGMTSAMFSILAPGVHLPCHEGPFAGVLRYHLGVLVPPGDVCRIEVDGISRTWPEGGSLIFDDTHPHEVWNGSDRIRIVLFVDFVRPMWRPFQWGVHAIFAVARCSPFGRTFVRNANRLAPQP